jgi:hypothetical protein
LVATSAGKIEGKRLKKLSANEYTFFHAGAGLLSAANVNGSICSFVDLVHACGFQQPLFKNGLIMRLNALELDARTRIGFRIDDSASLGNQLYQRRFLTNIEVPRGNEFAISM